MFVHNNGTLENTEQKRVELKEEINTSIIMVEFNILISIMSRTNRLKVNKNLEDLNNAIIQLDLINNYRTFHLTTVK